MRRTNSSQRPLDAATRHERRFVELSQTAGFVDQRRRNIRVVLAPLDGSSAAEHALPHALAIARRSGALLRIACVQPAWDRTAPWTLLTQRETLGQEQREYLLDVARRIAHTNDVPVQTIHVDSNDTVGSLATAAANVDMVVVASRRQSWWRWLYPRVVDGLRRHLRIPLLCVPGYTTPVDLTGDPAPRQILVPLDGSLQAERILAPAATVGHCAGATLSLLNVQNHDWTSGSLQHTDPHGYLMGVAREVTRSVPSIEAHVLTTDQPVARAVSTFAQRQNVDLVALSSCADRGLARWLRGSVADSLLSRTSVPVLLLGGAVEQARAALTTVVRASR